MFLITLIFLFFSFTDISNYSLVTVQKAYKYLFNVKSEILRDPANSFRKCELFTSLSYKHTDHSLAKKTVKL